MAALFYLPFLLRLDDMLELLSLFLSFLRPYLIGYCLSTKVNGFSMLLS